MVADWPSAIDQHLGQHGQTIRYGIDKYLVMSSFFVIDFIIVGAFSVVVVVVIFITIHFDGLFIGLTSSTSSKQRHQSL